MYLLYTSGKRTAFLGSLLIFELLQLFFQLPRTVHQGFDLICQALVITFNQLSNIVNQIALLMQGRQRTFAGNGFYAADAGCSPGFRDNSKQTDIAGTTGVD